jgi:hydrogenase/urease accessory protein HupE
MKAPARMVLQIIGRVGLLGVLLCALDAAAHPLAPALLELREAADGQVDVRFKTSLYPKSRQAAELLLPVLPDACAAASDPRASIEGSGKVVRWQIRCPAGLVGARVGVRGLAENHIDALLRVELADGRRVQQVLRAGRESLTIPVHPQRLDVFVDYLEVGVRHIFEGLDHLLLVFGLVLLVAGGRGYGARLLVTLSAFTLGHCATLSLAALGWLVLPGPPVELAIALSVLLLAVELARGRLGHARRLLPWALAGCFGLLHGLGFAAALLEAGLPQGEIGVALLAFNLGIEVGQVAVVAMVAIVLALAAGLQALRSEPLLPLWAYGIPIYVIGSLAAMWSFERAAALFP